MTPVDFFLLTLGPGSRTTAIESFKRIARVSEVDDWTTIVWESLTLAETTILRARLLAQFSPTTAQLTLSMLRGVLRAAEKMELLSCDARMRAIQWPRLRAKATVRGRALTGDEIVRLRRHCRETPPPYGEFLVGVFGVLLGTGCRREELATLTVNALHGERLRILGKGQKERLLKLPSWSLDDLRVWLGARDRLRIVHPRLFVRVSRQGHVAEVPLSPWGVWNLVASTTEDLKLEGITTNDFRRTYASHLLDTTDITNVQRLMGHASMTTTVLYDRRGQDAADKAVDALEVFGNTVETDG